MISSDVTVPFFFFSKKSVLHKHEKSRQFELTGKKILVFATKVHIFVITYYSPLSQCKGSLFSISGKFEPLGLREAQICYSTL